MRALSLLVADLIVFAGRNEFNPLQLTGSAEMDRRTDHLMRHTRLSSDL